MENGVESMMGQLVEQMAQLERVIAGMEERHAHVCGDVQKIVATAEGAFGEAGRGELERKLAEAEAKIASLQAQMQQNATETVRKTAAMVPMVSKSGVERVGSFEAGALDAALEGLSLEQRIAVKSQLLKAGY